MRRLFPLVLATVMPAIGAADVKIQLDVDAALAPLKLIHTDESLSAPPGPMTLSYAHWIPGEHAPDGPIEGLVNLHFFAGGQEIPWRRDLVDLYAFHIDVPRGSTALSIKFDYAVPTGSGAFGSSVSTTAKLAVINWYQNLLAPEKVRPDQIVVAASLHLPSGWKTAGSLVVDHRQGDTVSFAPTNLALLNDHPILAGEHVRSIELFSASSPEGEHALDVVGDHDWAVQIPDARIEHYRQLVREERHVFGGVGHYARYHWLVTLSDAVGGFGVEHHECSDDRGSENMMTDDNAAKQSAILLPHEFFHSWNGKYRRPIGLVNGGFEKPMKDDGLWVYEGLTNYYGEVMAARSGLWAPDDYLNNLALNAFSVSGPGRQWRNLQDTADSAAYLYLAAPSWGGLKRSTDFYAEGSLIWLQVDAKIRELTQGKSSLDTFCKLFHGIGVNGKVDMKPYETKEVFETLNRVAPYDWQGMLERLLTVKSADLPLDGLRACGYDYVYNDTPNAALESRLGGGLSLEASLGIHVGPDGAVAEAWPGSPAFLAGIGGGFHILSVNGQKFSSDVLKRAITDAAKSPDPIHLTVDNGGFVTSVDVPYHGGMKYPHIVRVQGKDDVLAKILAPQASP